MTWEEHQEWEREWHNDCVRTEFAERTKQITYAHRMGLVNWPANGCWPQYDLEGKSVLDIGGGPYSLLLNTRNPGRMVIADPCDYPMWVHARYAEIKATFVRIAGEDIDQYLDPDHFVFDEVWIYNVLQHVKDPGKILANARRLGKALRIFEWVDLPPTIGHPHELKVEQLREWIGASDSVGWGVYENFMHSPENGCNAPAFYGYFDWTK
jgi:hypothetical protein